MPRCRTGLTDLAELGLKGKDALILGGLIVEGLAAGKKGSGIAQKIRQERFGFGYMGSAAGLFLGPACACDEKQSGVRTNGLGIGGKRLASCASGGLNQHLQVVSIGKTSTAVWRAASEGRIPNVSRWRELAAAISFPGN